MPWWTRYALATLGIIASFSVLCLWAVHNRVVMEILAGITLAELIIGGLWLIAGSADREMIRRRKCEIEEQVDP